MDGPVLITGGAGFMGHHIIRALLKQSTCRNIVSVNRNPKQNLHPGVDYRAGNISDEKFIQSLIDEVEPQVVIHTASPTYNSARSTLNNSNIQGTRVLLKLSAQAPSVKAFI